jgi:hypothetical protein
VAQRRLDDEHLRAGGWLAGGFADHDEHGEVCAIGQLRELAEREACIAVIAVDDHRARPGRGDHRDELVGATRDRSDRPAVDDRVLHQRISGQNDEAGIHDVNPAPARRRGNWRRVHQVRPMLCHADPRKAVLGRIVPAHTMQRFAASTTHAPDGGPRYIRAATDG